MLALWQMDMLESLVSWPSGSPMENVAGGLKAIQEIVAHWFLHQESCDSYAVRELQDEPLALFHPMSG
jgi:hypothetical protein